MKKFIAIAIFILASFALTDQASAQHGKHAKWHANKNKPFALRFPNFAKKIGANHGYEAVVGTVEWSRTSYTQMGVDDCGRTIQWRATDITYRHILCNGAYGDCFTHTRRDSPIEYVVPVHTATHTGVPSAKGAVVSSGKSAHYK